MATPPVKVPCPWGCGEFSKRGLPGHLAMKHNNTLPDGTQAQQPKAQDAERPAAPPADAKRIDTPDDRGDDTKGVFDGWD